MMRSEIHNIPSIETYEPNKSVKTPPDSTVVLVGGCFDILHLGHMDYLEKAKSEGDYLIVALEPDQSIVNHKKRPAVHTQLERAHNLTALRFVDKVLLLPPLDGFQGYNQLTQDVAPHIIAVTEGDLQMSNITAQAFNVKAKLLVVNSHIANFSSSIIYKLSQL